MDFLWDSITEWLKELLVSGIINNLSGMFDQVNQRVGEIAGQVGTTPQAWNGGVFNMVRNLSETVIVPIAGAILAFVMTLELIQLIIDKNNLHDLDTWMFLKWIFKTASAILIVTNTWNIVMGVFDVAQSVVNNAAGVIISDTSIDISSVVNDMETRLMAMDLGPLFGLWFQSLFVGITMWALTICIFIIVYGRMVEIYLVTSIAPIPMATMLNREWGQMGQNYLRSLFALGFQAFLIIICVGIYAVLVQNISVASDISTAIWTCMGYTVLLCFTLFKTGSLPLGLNQIEIQRSLTTSSTAIFIPFTTQELFQSGREALYYGLNALSNNLIMVDRKKLKNPNGLILGTPGSGKSFSAKREMSNAFLITNDDIAICDPEGEYFPLVQRLGGQKPAVKKAPAFRAEEPTENNCKTGSRHSEKEENRTGDTLMAHRKRTVQLHFMVTEHERELIRQKMAQLGTNNLGVYLRKMAIDGYIVKLELPELSELLSLLRRTSNNVNQIARRVHETGNIYDTDLGDILQKQQELWDGVNEILSRLGGIP